MEDNFQRTIKKNVHKLRFLKADFEDHEFKLKEAKSFFLEEFSRLHKGLKPQILRKKLEEFRGHPEDFEGEGHIQDPIAPKKDDQPHWAKSLYKRIARQTHPDKLLNMGLDENQKKVRRELFRKCSDSFSSGEYGELLDAAIHLDLEFDGPVEDYVSHLNNLTNQITDKIDRIKKTIEFVWFNSVDDGKVEIMKHYFESQGLPDPYDKLNWKKPTRKTGEKPKRKKSQDAV